MTQLKRRGFSLGNIPKTQPKIHDLSSWNKGYPIFLQGQCLDSLKQHTQNIKQTQQLVNAILDEQDCDAVLAQDPYTHRLEPKFQSLGSVFNANDQEIEMINFDVMDGDEIIAEDLWMKASWLSFHEEDASLRFRFSFGVDFEEDVAADPYRQQLSAELTDAVFPESSIITNDVALNDKLKSILDSNKVNFVERIIYFNAPNGGAYMHNDLERGHAGVVFAQVTGSTFWLALPKSALIEEIINFSKNNPWPDSLSLEMKNELDILLKDQKALSDELYSMSNDSVMHLINETKEFIQFLILKGHSFELKPGDMLLLPQENKETCCWHSVFSLGEEIGQALSFAIRG